MRKSTLILCLAMLLLAVSCNDKEIEAINQRLDNIENVSIASIQTQMTQMSTTLGMLQSTQTQLSGYVTSLQTSVGTLEGNYTSLQSAVTALQQKDQTFESNLQELQTAIGGSANDVKRWVESSYATLQQFNQVQTDITGIKTDIQTIFSRLDGLDQATQTIANNLRDATADLTGKLGRCQEDIAGILEDLEALQGDMDTVKAQIAAIISAVQSVVVVPDYTDGSVKMTNDAKNIIRFEVYPLEAAEKLATLGVSALSLDYIETKAISDALVNIPLTAVYFDGEFMKITADGTGIKDEVNTGTVGANARLRISDGTVVKSSEYFPIFWQRIEKYFVESAWTLSHSLDETTYPGYPHKFTNTVAVGSSTDKYFFAVYPESDIEDTSNLPAFIEEVLPDEVENLEYRAEKNHKTIADYLSVGTESEWYRLAYKKYYVFAIGLTDEGEPTGAYAYMTYYNEPDEVAKAEYNKWLGNWLLGADSIPIEVFENESCVDYRIKGYGSTIAPDGFLANFNSSTNSLVFYNQTIGMDDQYEIQWNGVVEYQGSYVVIIGGAYTIGTATMSSDGISANIVAGKVTLSTGEIYSLVGMNYYAHFEDKFYTYNACPDLILIPSTMVRPSSETQTGSTTTAMNVTTGFLPSGQVASTMTTTIKAGNLSAQSRRSNVHIK